MLLSAPPAQSLDAFRDEVDGKEVPAAACLEHLQFLLSRRYIRGSKDCAEATALVLRRVIEDLATDDASTIISAIDEAGRNLERCQHLELAVGNIFRRVQRLANEECATAAQGGDADSDSKEDVTDLGRGTLVPATGTTSKPTSLANSMFNLLSKPLSEGLVPSEQGRQPPDVLGIRDEVGEAITELVDEINQADDQIAGFAMEHIHSSEVILVQRPSPSISHFLRKAAGKRRFTLVQVESDDVGHQDRTVPTANGKSRVRQSGSSKALSATTLFVPQSAVFAVMARVSKVILDASTVMADGSMVGPTGSSLIAKAARRHQVPVIALSGVYRVSPLFPHEAQVVFEEVPGPSDQFEDLDKSIDTFQALHDHVNADDIDLYVTNIGGSVPSSIYKILAEHYGHEENLI